MFWEMRHVQKTYDVLTAEGNRGISPRFNVFLPTPYPSQEGNIGGRNYSNRTGRNFSLHGSHVLVKIRKTLIDTINCLNAEDSRIT